MGIVGSDLRGISFAAPPAAYLRIQELMQLTELGLRQLTLFNEVSDEPNRGAGKDFVDEAR
jgi:hypothetical protein